MEVKMAERILDRIKFWLELRKWERQKRKEGFPIEWFQDDNSIDNVDMGIELELGSEQLGEE